MPYSSGGRPATALSPMLGISRPSKRQTSVPSSLRTTTGAPVLPLGRQVAVEHVRRLDDVVVDTDHDHVVDAHACARDLGAALEVRRRIARSYSMLGLALSVTLVAPGMRKRIQRRSPTRKTPPVSRHSLFEPGPHQERSGPSTVTMWGRWRNSAP